MSFLTDTVSYQTAEGLLNGNLADQNKLFYGARALFLRAVYGSAFTSTSPAAEWLQTNRSFFSTSTQFNYVISSITFPIFNGTVYCCSPTELPLITEQAAAQGIELNSETFGSWVGTGSQETFYW